MKLSDSDGEILVKTARLAVTEYLKRGRIMDVSNEIKVKFSYNSGIFVTLTKEENLRGCIGFPTPERKLYSSLVDSAVAAATEDPRFAPVKHEELDDIIFEITILTPPVVIKVKNPSEYPSMIKIGRDGLIIKWEFGSGLLLPQVPLEYGWNEEEFLNYTCEKAGASKDYWKRKSTQILKFEGIVFKEIKPNGPIKRVELP
jgi:hypothetical protein